MAIFVNTNVSSLHGSRNLNNIQNSLSTTYNRLSSGLRINSAKDDAAGLQISDRLTTQINGLNQGNRNASDAIALAQTVESGLDEVTNMLQRMRTLAVQASNGTNTTEDRAALTKEAGALSFEITRIAEQTKFGGKTVLAGTGTADAGNDSIYANGTNVGDAGEITFQVGANTNDTIGMTVQNFKLSKIAVNAGIITEGGGGAYSAKAPKDEGDDDENAGGPATAPTGPEGEGAGVGAAGKAVRGLAMEVVGQDGEGKNITQMRIALSTQEAASDAITTIDALIKQVDTQRADLGSVQNRLESTIRNQANVSANQADARSRIRDTDFAEESANLTQQNIIQQAASSMLMQANMRPQLALSLLG